MEDAREELAPNRARVADVAALVGWLAVYEAGLLTGEVPHELTARFADRLVLVGLLEPGHGERELRQAIGDLNQRLRFVLGEYGEPPEPDPVSVGSA